MKITEEQKKLLTQYRDKAYVMSILCSECSDYYSRINNFFKFPLILTNSIMVIFNSENFENIRANIDEYDTINEQIEYPFVGYIKDKLIKKYSNNRSMPNALNCVASEIVITNV